jgi:hypothetical protein
MARVLLRLAHRRLHSANVWLIAAAFSLTGVGLPATLQQVACRRDRGLAPAHACGCSALFVVYGFAWPARCAIGPAAICAPSPDSSSRRCWRWDVRRASHPRCKRRVARDPSSVIRHLDIAWARA